ncbi:MAG: DUF58 domain-containing protein [Planctomycetota bacterium]|nr:DUF58 domain-containing protein [Planctomycetaceae bacterium]MDQ3329287.1 DUF58 domain-containing protein [Planctomycetota bacterium]
MRSDPDVQRIVSRYRLGLPKLPSLGRSGELLGRGVGSSLEFQEHREYRPGDDLRHLDWAAYGRSDALMLRLFREEISPKTQILLDASRSMTAGGGAKSNVARQLATVFALLSAGLGGSPQVIPLDGSRPPRAFGMSELDRLSSLTFETAVSIADLATDGGIPPGKRAVRLVISDFLFPHDPERLVRRLAGDVTALWMIQTLAAFEADPLPLGGRKLIDAETGDESNLVLDRRTIAAYRERLTTLQQGLSRQCRRFHATFVTVVADRGLEAVCREELCAAELLRPA